MALFIGVGGLACATANGSGSEPVFEDRAPAQKAPAGPPTFSIAPTLGFSNLEAEGETAGEAPASGLDPGSEPIPLIPERRLLSLEWPARIRTGDSDIIRLSLEVDQQGQLTPTAFFGEHEFTTEAVEIENLYDSHMITAEARLDMAGIAVEPAGTISKRLFPGESLDFSWSVSPTAAGTYRGTVWMFLRFVPFEEGDELERVLLSRPVEIETLNLLGLGGQPARLLGAVGTAVGSLLGLDDIFKWIRRLRRRRGMA